MKKAMYNLKSWRYLSLDLLFFILPTLIFNTLYHIKFLGELDGIVLNIYLMFLLWLILTSIRLLLALFIHDNKMPLVNFILMGSLWIGQLILYCLCYIGLAYWGKVPTINMIKMYAIQIEALINTLNITSFMLILLAIVTLVILYIFYKLIWSKTSWLSIIAHKLHRGISLFVFSSLIITGVILFWENLYYSDVKNEAFFEVFFPEMSSKKIQGLRISSSKTLALEANTSRINYKPSNNKSRNIILIVIDALRADHLSINGYPRKTSPFISSLNKQGSFKSISSIRSVCSESSCGLLAIAHSKFPNAITASDFSLYEVLKKYGYHIFFLLSGDQTNFYGMKDAFKPYDIYIDGSFGASKFSKYVNDDRFILNQLKKIPQFNGTPTFIQFHLMSVHGLGLRYSQDYPYYPAKNYYSPLAGSDKNSLARNYYDNGVYQMDSIIADIFLQLKEKGYLKDAIVVITADHGESLGENGLYSHAKSVSEPVLNIPLIVWSSKLNDSALDFKKWPIASQVDIAPSILNALNMNIPTSWHGLPLQAPPEHRTIFAAQGDEVAVYAEYQGALYKLTLDKKTATEQSSIINPNTKTQEKATIPPTILKQMRLQLFKVDM